MATRRVQVQYDPRGTGLRQFTARPIQTVQARYDTPQETSAARLARYLGVLDAGTINANLSRLQEIRDEEERRRAREFASSITLEELGKRIRNGEMLPSQSPVFAATVQHIYGENSQKALERDILGKLSSGQLKFSTPEELDEYLTNARNEHLQDQSEYTLAGFDKGWNNFRSKAAELSLKVNDAEATARAIAEANDNLNNVLLEVTDPSFKGGDQQRARAILSRYELLTTTDLLRDDVRKEVLGGTLLRVASSGNYGLLTELLNSKLPNNGPTVGGMLGPRTVESLIRTAEVELMRQEKAALQQANIMAAEAITAQAQQTAALLVAQRRGYEMPDFQVPTPDGGTKTVKGADLVKLEVEKHIAANPNMPLDEQVRLYANNSVENTAWKNAITTAYKNLGEVGIDAQGKPIGELLSGTLEALELFSVINQVSTGYAQEMAGGEEKYQTFVNIQALREAGVTNPHLAAALVDQANRNTAKNMESINSQVNSAVNKITDPGIFTSRFWGEVFAGEWGEGEKNVLAMRGAVTSLAKAYMAAGVAATGDDAVRLAVEYYANPAVTTQINNAIYMNKDLPRVPENQDQRTWMKRFMDEKVAADLEAMGIEYDKDDIYLHPMRGGEGRFMLHLNGTPIGITYLRRDIEQWIIEQDNADIEERIRRRTAPQADSFIESETTGGAAIIYRNPRTQR